MPLYDVTIIDAVEGKMRVRVEMPDEDAAQELAGKDYGRGPNRRLAWYKVAEDSDYDVPLEPFADDAAHPSRHYDIAVAVLVDWRNDHYKKSAPSKLFDREAVQAAVVHFLQMRNTLRDAIPNAREEPSEEQTFRNFYKCERCGHEWEGGGRRTAEGYDGMKIDLSGGRAIVTGLTAGIGRATAEGLARAGAAVVVNGRGSERVAAAVRAIQEAVPGSDITGVAADLATAEGAQALIAAAPDADILVNNVGTAHLRDYRGIDDIAAIPDEDWLSLFQLNVMSGVRASRHYLPGMVRRRWGRVVFVSSESAVNIPKEMLDYGMTKAGQLAVSRGLAEAVAGTGVTVNAVLPGPTRSEILGDFMASQAKAQGITQEEAEQAFLKSARPTSLLGRFATTDEVANMIVYTCSEQASATAAPRCTSTAASSASSPDCQALPQRIHHDRNAYHRRTRPIVSVGALWVGCAPMPARRDSPYPAGCAPRRSAPGSVAGGAADRHHRQRGRLRRPCAQAHAAQLRGAAEGVRAVAGRGGDGNAQRHAARRLSHHRRAR